jgi:hypothetical protein
MSQRPAGSLAASVVLALLLMCLASSAGAQTVRPESTTERSVRAGGDFSAIWGPRDDIAFFNYTDYEHNALRLARMRLSAEWRPQARVSFLGQLQTENDDSIETIAAYVRWRPWATRGFVVQAGRIPPVIGAYARRAYGHDNAVIGSPLAYQYLTSLRPDALPATSDDVLRMRGRGWQSVFPIGSAALRQGLPLVSSRWDTGVQASWRGPVLELAGAVTMGAPAQPRLRATNDGRQWSGRTAFHLPSGLTAGVSGARGSWIDRGVLSFVPLDRRRSAQTLVGADLEYGRGRWLVRAEWLRAVFAVPLAGGPAPGVDLAAASAFADVRYRLHPRWQIGVRLDRLTFSRLQDTISGDPVQWDAPVSRLETVVGFRVRRSIDLRAGWQHDWRAGGRVRQRGYPAVQALVWF